MKKTVVLVHGAWHGRWCWKKVVPLLEAEGYAVLAPDLPGHGGDSMDFGHIVLETYTDSVMAGIRSVAGKVVLAGHSMAGAIVSQVAENMADKIERLVYVSAFVPPDGGSVSQEARKAKVQTIAEEMLPDKIRYEIDLKKSPRLKELFYNACSDEDAQFALAHLQKEPLKPFMGSIYLSQERFGQVKKTYISCLKDAVVLPEDQKRIYTAAKCDVVILKDADHSPFFSAVEELVKGMIK